jgi:hypothetical protein
VVSSGQLGQGGGGTCTWLIRRLSCSLCVQASAGAQLPWQRCHGRLNNTAVQLMTCQALFSCPILTSRVCACRQGWQRRAWRLAAQQHREPAREWHARRRGGRRPPAAPDLHQRHLLPHLTGRAGRRWRGHLRQGAGRHGPPVAGRPGGVLWCAGWLPWWDWAAVPQWERGDLLPRLPRRRRWRHQGGQSGTRGGWHVQHPLGAWHHLLVMPCHLYPPPWLLLQLPTMHACVTRHLLSLSAWTLLPLLNGCSTVWCFLVPPISSPTSCCLGTCGSPNVLACNVWMLDQHQQLNQLYQMYGLLACVGGGAVVLQHTM